MTKRYLGNIITQNPTAPAGPFEDGAASGVWSLAEAFAYSKAGLWPTAGNSQRGLFGAGVNSSFAAVDNIEYVTISTTGNALDFGDLTVARNYGVGASSATRGLFLGDSGNNTIDYVTIASAGNASNFGDMGPSGYYYPMGTSNGTRAVYNYGYNLSSANNVINYVTIATTGDGSDFGDLTVARHSGGALSSPTRAIFGGGQKSSGQSDVMDYVTISSTGNATDFGNMVSSGKQNTFAAGCSSSTRGLWLGGANSYTETISYITIASAGNAADFGDLSSAKGYMMSTSSQTRGLGAGGYNPLTNVIEYVTIATTGNASDFGDLNVLRGVGGACSNVHGGLAA